MIYRFLENEDSLSFCKNSAKTKVKQDNIPSCFREIRECVKLLDAFS
jgi:hypothetical protein